MNKRQFLDFLRNKLKRFPQAEINDAVGFYDEIISDKMRNEYLTESAAVASLGEPNTIAANCASEMLTKTSQKNPLTVAAILLGVLASPLLLPLAIVLFVFYIVVFVVWIALIIGFGAGALGAIVGGIGICFSGYGFGYCAFGFGCGLVAFAVLASLCYVTAVFGAKFINLITVRLAKAVFNRKK